jgi:cytochrome c oxidase assembly protein subunit 15
MIDQQIKQKNNRQVAIWLLIGVGMIVIQVLLGGITRLTESGLSITEWKPITGALPPLNNAAWQIEFEKYRHTDQFKYVHQYFSLKEFKFIFFWEWFHRLWARMMGMVFLIGFIYFIIKKKFNPSMIRPMVILFLLGAMQGAIGWFMVKSGLVPEKYFVGHVELTTHFISAIILLAYTFWFALTLLPSINEKIYNKKIGNLLMTILILLLVQLIYGGFMAGLKAASTAPTWPSINGEIIPTQINELSPWIQNIFNNKIAIHFIHRGMAYLLFIFVIVFYIKSKILIYNQLFKKLRISFLFLISLQVILGICALLNATNNSLFIWIGVAHQFTAIMLVMSLVALLFLVRRTTVVVKV